MYVGINNSSESDYIKSFAAYGLESGYRVIVHNHLGALKSEKLTAHRIFTYGKFSYSRSHNLIFNVVQSDNFFQSSETSLKDHLHVSRDQDHLHVSRDHPSKSTISIDLKVPPYRGDHLPIRRPLFLGQ